MCDDPLRITFFVAFAPDTTVEPPIMGRIEIIMIESKFKSKQKEDFEAKGWKFITLEPSAGVPTGFPDTLVLSPTGYTCYTEWKKAKTAKRQPLQEYWNKKLNSMGHDAFFVHPSNVEEWRQYVISRSNEAITLSLPGGLPRPTWQ